MKCEIHPISCIKLDTVELTPEYQRISDEMEKEVATEFEKYITTHRPRRTGKCHIYWKIKKRILKEKYGIEWQSPAELNPLAKFD